MWLNRDFICENKEIELKNYDALRKREKKKHRVSQRRRGGTECCMYKSPKQLLETPPKWEKTEVKCSKGLITVAERKHNIGNVNK